MTLFRLPMLGGFPTDPVQEPAGAVIGVLLGLGIAFCLFLKHLSLRGRSRCPECRRPFHSHVS